jgi:hypothetical protein
VADALDEAAGFAEGLGKEVGKGEVVSEVLKSRIANDGKAK